MMAWPQARVRRCNRLLILKGWAVTVDGVRVKKHASLEAAAFHALAVNSPDTVRLKVIEDHLWAGRC
jgi:hypothetical protein